MADELLYEKWFYAYGGKVKGESRETRTPSPRGGRGATAAAAAAVNWGGDRRRQGKRRGDQQSVSPRLQKATDTTSSDAATDEESSHYPSFWDQEGTSSYLSESAPSKPYFEVDDDTLSMMREGMKSYREHIQAAIVELEGVEGETRAEVHMRWEYVNQAETADKSLKELKRQSLNYQRDWSAVRSTYFNTETALQQLSNDNSAVEAVHREEGKTLAQAFATMSVTKAEKETLLRKIQLESEREINVTADLQLNGEREREREVSLCIDNVEDMKRNISAARAKLTRSKEATSVLSEECEKIESSLVSANKDLKMLRNAQRVEETVLEAELAVSDMDDAEINNSTSKIIKEVNDEINQKKQLQMLVKEMQTTSKEEIDVTALFKREEAGWKRLHTKLRHHLESLQKKKKDQELDTRPCSNDFGPERKENEAQSSKQPVDLDLTPPVHHQQRGVEAKKKSSKKKARVAKIN